MKNVSELFRTALVCASIGALPALATEVIATTNQGDVLQYNTLTGSYTLLASGQAVLWGIGYTSNGILYANDNASAPNTGFYKVNPNTGALTPVGTIGGSTSGYGTMTSPVSGGTLYYVSQSEQLYRINPSTGAPTAVGSLGYNVSGSNDAAFAASGNLYATSNENFYEINPATGAATLIGNTGEQLQALIAADGGIYGFGGDSMYSINLSSGDLTFVRNTPSSLGNFDAGIQVLSPITSPTPEPASLVLFGLGIGAALIRGYSKRAAPTQE